MKKLNVFERLGILAILPQEGNFVTLKILRDLKSKIGITEQEMIEYELKPSEDGSKLNFNPQKMIDPNNDGKFIEKEFDFGLKAEEMICDALKKKNDEKKLTEAEFSLYEKFIEIPEVGESKE